MIQARPRKEAGWTVELFPYRGVEMEASKERIFLSVDAVSWPPEKRRPELSADSAPEYDCRPRSTYVPCLPVMFGVAPNITGSSSFHAMSDNSVRDRATFTGALYQGEKGSYSAGASYDQSNFVMGFDASKSSALFGRSSTVQPPSISLLSCIKF